MVKRIADKVLSPLTFQIVLLIATAFMLVPFLHYAYGGYVKYILFFGVFVCIWQLFVVHRFSELKDIASIALLCFALFYAITIFLNRGNLLAENVKQWLYMIVFFILLFSLVIDFDDGIVVVSGTISVLSFFLTANSMLTYVYNINEWYVTNSRYFIGMYNRFGGFYNPNTCGAVATISIIASLFLIFKIRKLASQKLFLHIVLQMFLIINTILQIIVLLISESRGAYFSLLITATIVIFLATVKNFKRNKLSAVIRVIASLFLCALFLFVFIRFSTIFQEHKTWFCIVSQEEADNPEYDTEYEDVLEDLLKKYTNDSSALTGVFDINALSIKNYIGKAVGRYNATDTTSRLPIWQIGFSTFKEKPFFGWTREGSVLVLNERYEQTMGRPTGSISGGGLHNIYLTILCASGVVGFVCFFVLIGTVFTRFLKCIFADERISLELLFSFAVSMYFLISELVESRILYTVSFFNVVFWIYFGYLNYYSKREKKALEKNT